jgi:hypothetical protein
MSRMFSFIRRRGNQGSRRCFPDVVDPLDHPDLRSMTLAELADLPLEPVRSAGCGTASGSYSKPAIECGT